jgi:hypothetical protein
LMLGEEATSQKSLAGSSSGSGSESGTDVSSTTSEATTSSCSTDSESDDNQAMEHPVRKRKGGQIPSQTILSRLAESDRIQSTSVRVVHGREYHSCELPGISLFKRHGGGLGASEQQPQRGENMLLGYVCLVRASNQVLVFVNCTTVEDILQLENHQFVAALRTVAQGR